MCIDIREMRIQIVTYLALCSCYPWPDRWWLARPIKDCRILLPGWNAQEKGSTELNLHPILLKTRITRGFTYVR